MNAQTAEALRVEELRRCHQEHPREARPSLERQLASQGANFPEWDYPEFPDRVQPDRSRRTPIHNAPDTGGSSPITSPLIPLFLARGENNTAPPRPYVRFIPAFYEIGRDRLSAAGVWKGNKSSLH